MTTETLTLNIPAPLLDRLRNLARLSERSVEDETLELLAASIPIDELPADLSTDLADLALLDDAALHRAAASHFPNESARALETLNLKQQREGLTVSERDTQKQLMHQYERALLIRSQAAGLLHERGYAPSGPGEFP